MIILLGGQRFFTMKIVISTLAVIAVTSAAVLHPNDVKKRDLVDAATKVHNFVSGKTRAGIDAAQKVQDLVDQLRDIVREPASEDTPPLVDTAQKVSDILDVLGDFYKGKDDDGNDDISDDRRRSVSDIAPWLQQHLKIGSARTTDSLCRLFKHILDIPDVLTTHHGIGQKLSLADQRRQAKEYLENHCPKHAVSTSQGNKQSGLADLAARIHNYVRNNTRNEMCQLMSMVLDFYQPFSRSIGVLWPFANLLSSYEYNHCPQDDVSSTDSWTGELADIRARVQQYFRGATTHGMLATCDFSKRVIDLLAIIASSPDSGIPDPLAVQLFNIQRAVEHHCPKDDVTSVDEKRDLVNAAKFVHDYMDYKTQQGINAATKIHDFVSDKTQAGISAAQNLEDLIGQIKDITLQPATGHEPLLVDAAWRMSNILELLARFRSEGAGSDKQKRDLVDVATLIHKLATDRTRAGVEASKRIQALIGQLHDIVSPIWQPDHGDFPRLSDRVSEVVDALMAFGESSESDRDERDITDDALKGTTLLLKGLTAVEKATDTLDEYAGVISTAVQATAAANTVKLLWNEFSNDGNDNVEDDDDDTVIDQALASDVQELRHYVKEGHDYIFNTTAEVKGLVCRVKDIILRPETDTGSDAAAVKIEDIYNEVRGWFHSRFG